MKTTIEIAPTLLEEARRLASRRRTTLRALVEEGLRHVLETRRSPARPYVLPDTTVAGKGLQPGVADGSWARIRDLIYEGRGA